MATHVIKKDQTATVEIAESNSDWMLAKGVTLSGSPAVGTDVHDDLTLSIDGRILTSGSGIYLGSSLQGERSDSAVITVAKSGRIGAEFFGVAVFGDGASIENDGQIRTQSAEAIYVEGDNVSINNNGVLRTVDAAAIDLAGSTLFSIRNTGRIETVTNGFAITGKDVADGHVVNTKSGVIDGAISFKDASAIDGSVEIVNKGTIAEDASFGTVGIIFGDGNDRLTNQGLIGGYVDFRDGDDFGDFRRGSLNGNSVHGGKGNDIFVVSDNETKIIEFVNSGTDSIWTTVSYTLGNTIFDSIEKLAAIGKKNIDLIGNDQSNDLSGNAGNNMLSGGDGDDILTGNRGNDVLSGGDGADDFYFYRMTGNDRIVGLDVDQDVIQIGGIPGIGSIDDLENHLTTAKNGDVIIDLGTHGSIRLAGIGVADSDDIEFQIEL